MWWYVFYNVKVLYNLTCLGVILTNCEYTKSGVYGECVL